MSERDPYTQVLKAGPGPAGLELLEQVAVGPFSEVWRARDRDLDLALKFARGAQGARMLAEEARVAETLSGGHFRATASPLVVSVRRHVADPGPGLRPYLVMPWIDGGTFRERLDAAQGPDARAQNAELFLSLVEGVSVVHGRGIVHGDLKPENVLIQTRGETEEPLLTDFGLASHRQAARLEQSLRASLQTDDALTGGTLAYMAPEVVKGGQASRASDVYALGVILHEVLLGRRPTKLTTPAELIRVLPEEVVEILVRALSVDPGERHTDARALFHELGQVRGALTARGAGRVGRLALRFVLAGLAAFFVALRYAFVFVLLCAYLACGLATLVGLITTGVGALAGLIPLVCMGALHLFVRWEGPETVEEAKERARGQIARR